MKGSIAMGSSSKTPNPPMDSARDTNTAHRSEPEEDSLWPFGPILKHINRWLNPPFPESLPTVQPLTNASGPYPLKEAQDPPALLTLARAFALLRRAGLSSEAKVWRRFGFSIWDEELCHRLLREAQEAYADVPQESDVDHADWLLYEVRKRCRGAERRVWHAAWDEYIVLRRPSTHPTPPPIPQPLPEPAIQGAGSSDSEEDDWHSCASRQRPSPKPVREEIESLHYRGSKPQANQTTDQWKIIGGPDGVIEHRRQIMYQWELEDGPEGVIERVMRQIWLERLGKYSADWH